MIELQDVSVIFDNKGPIHAVDNVNLSINDGEVFGIIGYSGAGKSTLVRTINMLQPPTKGHVKVNQQDLTTLSVKELRQVRKKIGMIFQHFNLMNARNVFDNVAFPLKHSHLSKNEKNEKVLSLLKLVGLDDKANAYPSQLSGGQKQRVAIARALANDPDVLLCDEATSALDPKTTTSILELLKSVNQKLGITIVIITHEMTVIKEICDRVAVMESGKVIEQGSIFNIFSEPQHALTRDFIESASPVEKGIKKVIEHAHLLNIHADDQILRVSFAGTSTGDALIATLANKFGVQPNILFGQVEILQDTPVGTLLLSLRGDREAIDAAIDYMDNQQISVQRLELSTHEGGVK